MEQTSHQPKQHMGCWHYNPWIQSLKCLLLMVLMIISHAGNVKPRHEKYLPNYNIYHNLSHIQSKIEALVSRNRKYMKIDFSYVSRQGWPQLLLHITNFTDSSAAIPHASITPKVKLLLSYGEHAREFLPVESLFYLLNNLTKGLTSPYDSHMNAFARMVLTKVDLFVVVIVNPDGRKHVEMTGNYCWRGTSTGVDLNRNFDWQFGNRGSSGDKNDEEYRGARAFSEPECAVLVDITSRYKMDAFVSLHSGIKQIYVPYADTQSKISHRKPANIDSMLELADQMSQVSSRSFKYGIAYQLNDYTADGTTFDYMAGVRKIPFSMAIELWGVGDHKNAECFDLFNPRSDQLQAAVEDIHPIYERLLVYLIQWKNKQMEKVLDPMVDGPPLTLGCLLLGGLVIVTILMAVQNRLPTCLRMFPRRRIISIRSLSSTFSMTSISRPKL